MCLVNLWICQSKCFCFYPNRSCYRCLYYYYYCFQLSPFKQQFILLASVSTFYIFELFHEVHHVEAAQHNKNKLNRNRKVSWGRNCHVSDPISVIYKLELNKTHHPPSNCLLYLFLLFLLIPLSSSSSLTTSHTLSLSVFVCFLSYYHVALFVCHMCV